MLLWSTFTSDCKPPIRALQSPRREMIQTPHFIHSLACSPVEQWVWTQKKQLLHSFHVMWTQQKTSAGGDREQLMLLLFICSKTGKGKLTRRMVILRFEVQNLKEQFTPNSRLHVFPHLCFCISVSGLCWCGFPTFSYFVFLEHEVHSSSWSTKKIHLKTSLQKSRPCYSWSPQTLLWAVSCGNSFLSTTLQPSNRACTCDGTLIPVTGCKHCWSPVEL